MRVRIAMVVLMSALAAQAGVWGWTAGDKSIVIDGQVKACPSVGAVEEAVPGAHVWAFLQGSEPGQARPGSTRKKTDELGKFRFELTPGRYAIVIHGGMTREFVPSAHYGLGDESRVNTLLVRTTYEPGRPPLPVSVAKANLEEIRKVIPAESQAPAEVKEYKKFLNSWITDLDTVLKEPVNILVPAYFNPAERPDDWKKISQAADKHKGKLQVVVILNPNSGPGAKADPNYATPLKDCVKSGARVIGYVALNFGKTPEAELRQAVDRYVQWYPQVSGFFFDELDDAEASVKIVRAVAAHARAVLKPAKGTVKKGAPEKTALLIGNPGKTIAAGPLVKDRILDVLCLYENDARPVRFVPPAWDAGPKTCALVYDLPKEAEMKRVTAGLLQSGVNTIYVTDGSRTKPDVRFDLQWGRLPTYWDSFLEAAAAR
jgi:hypothetical protein